MGGSSCVSKPVYPYEHYFYDRTNDRLIAKTADRDRPSSDCDPSTDNYFNCVVYRLSEHERLKARYLELVLKLQESERLLSRCK
jgi:hypothetical protein